MSLLNSISGQLQAIKARAAAGLQSAQEGIKNLAATMANQANSGVKNVVTETKKILPAAPSKPMVFPVAPTNTAAMQVIRKKGIEPGIPIGFPTSTRTTDLPNNIINRGVKNLLGSSLLQTPGERAMAAQAALEKKGVSPEIAARSAGLNENVPAQLRTSPLATAKATSGLNPEQAKALRDFNTKQSLGAVLDVAGIVPVGAAEKAAAKGVKGLIGKKIIEHEAGAIPAVAKHMEPFVEQAKKYATAEEFLNVVKSKAAANGKTVTPEVEKELIEFHAQATAKPIAAKTSTPEKVAELARKQEDKLFLEHAAQTGEHGEIADAYKTAIAKKEHVAATKEAVVFPNEEMEYGFQNFKSSANRSPKLLSMDVDQIRKNLVDAEGKFFSGANSSGLTDNALLDKYKARIAKEKSLPQIDTSLIKNYEKSGKKMETINKKIPTIENTSGLQETIAPHITDLPTITKPPIKPQDTVGNIRVDKFAIHPSAEGELKQIINDNAGFLEQRRGTQSFAETETLAKELTPKIKLKPGQSLNAEELQNLGNTVASLTKKVADIATEVGKVGGNSELALLRLAAAREELTFATASYAGATAEAGRSLSILRNMRQALEGGDTKLIKQALENSGNKKTNEEILKRIAAFGDDEIGKYRFVSGLSKDTWITKTTKFFNWFYYSNLLSGPLTHIKNTFSNAAKLGFDVGATPVNAAVDLAKSTGAKIAGKSRPREVYFGEIPEQLKGVWAGTKEGSKKALFMMQNGFSLSDVANSEFRHSEPFKGILPNVISRSLQASDDFFRSMSAGAELYGNAWSKATAEGLRGEARAARAAELVANPTKIMLEQMDRAGAQGVYQQTEDKFTKGILKLRQDWEIIGKDGSVHKIFNPAKFVVPFVKTPANIFKSGIELSPVGVVTGAFKKTARESSQAQGRAVLGTAILSSLAFMAADGEITGNGPSDPAVRDALYSKGWQPNSVKIGNKYYSYQTTPMAVPFSLMGAAADAWVYEGKKPSVGAIAFQAGNSLLNQSFLSGLSALQKATADPSRYGDQFIEGLATGFVPLSSALGQTARATDLTIRQPKGLKEKIQSIIPGLTQKLPAKRNVLGEESKRPGGFLNQFNPVKSSKELDTPIQKELDSFDFVLSVPGKSFDKRTMNNKQYSTFVEISGGFKKSVLSVLFKTSDWPTLDNETKTKMVEKAVSYANDQARRNLRGEVELDYFNLAHPQLNSTQREWLNTFITTTDYKKLPPETQRELMTQAWQKLRNKQ